MVARGSRGGGPWLRAAALLLLGLALVPPAGAEAGAGRPIPEALREAVERFVRERVPQSVSDVQIPSLSDFDVAGLGADDVEFRLSGGPDPRYTGVVPVTAVVAAAGAGGAELVRGVVTARVRSLVPVLVAARKLPRGARLRAGDFTREERDRAVLPADAIADPGRVVGRHAARSLPAGTLLRERMVETRPAVSRGQLVPLLYENGALRIDGRGKAREDGRAGDVIRVQNLASRREVSGRVDAEGVVHVDF